MAGDIASGQEERSKWPCTASPKASIFRSPASRRRSSRLAPPASRVALVAADYIGLKPTMLVQRRRPRAARHAALRGQEDARRALHGARRRHRRGDPSRRDARVPVRRHRRRSGRRPGRAGRASRSFRGRRRTSWTPTAVRALLVESGLWTAFRTRPFSRVPAPHGTPHAIFVTAIDTHPHAPAVDVVLAGRDRRLPRRAPRVARLCAGKTYVCKAAGSRVTAPGVRSASSSRNSRARTRPARAGLHIHLLDPVAPRQDRLAHRLPGRRRHRPPRSRPASSTSSASSRSPGPGAARPRLLRTRLGASLDDLTRGELQPGAQRVISGSVLDGRTAAGDVHGYLGRHHLQVAVLPEGRGASSSAGSRRAATSSRCWGVVLGALGAGGASSR